MTSAKSASEKKTVTVQQTASHIGRPGEQDLADLKVEGLLGIAAEKLTETIAAGGTEAILARRAMERLFVEYHRGSQT